MDTWGIDERAIAEARDPATPPDRLAELFGHSELVAEAVVANPSMPPQRWPDLDPYWPLLPQHLAADDPLQAWIDTLPMPRIVTAMRSRFSPPTPTIDPAAHVGPHVRFHGSPTVRASARLSGYVRVADDADVAGEVEDAAWVGGRAVVHEGAVVSGAAIVVAGELHAGTVVRDRAMVSLTGEVRDSVITDEASLDGSRGPVRGARIRGSSRLDGPVQMVGDIEVIDAKLPGGVRITGRTVVRGIELSHHAWLEDATVLAPSDIAHVDANGHSWNVYRDRWGEIRVQGLSRAQDHELPVEASRLLRDRAAWEADVAAMGISVGD